MHLAAMLALGLGLPAAQTPPKPTPPSPPAALRVVWQHDLALPEGVPENSKGAPRLAAGDSFYFLNSEVLGLTAYAADDGHEAWTSGHVSPLPSVPFGKHVAIASQGAVIVLDQATGAVAWQVNVPGDPQALFAFGDRVGVVVGKEVLSWSGPGDPTRTNLGAEAATRVVVHKGVLYVGLAEPALLAADAATGTVRWRIPLPARPQSLTASDDLLYLGAEDTRIYFYRTTGDPKWVKRRLLVATRGDPAVDERFVYFTFQDNTIRAFDRKGGSERWSKELGSRPKSGPIVLGSTLAVALETGAVVELTPKSGQILVPAEPPGLAEARLQSVAVNADRSRLFTMATKKDDSRIIVAWGHPAAK